MLTISLLHVSFALTIDHIFIYAYTLCVCAFVLDLYNLNMNELTKSSLDLPLLFINYYDFILSATKGNSLKEEWIAYVCREILRVRVTYLDLEIITT